MTSASASADSGVLGRLAACLCLSFGPALVIARRPGSSYEETAALSVTAAGHNSELAIPAASARSVSPRPKRSLRLSAH